MAQLNYYIYANDINFTYKILKLKNTKKLQFDLLQKKPLIKINDIDIFIHNSALTNPKDELYKDYLLKTNIQLTKQALLLAKKLKVKKFFLISSTSVYRGIQKDRFNERSRTSAKDPYSISKLLGEKIANRFCKKNNLQFSIFRLGNIYSGNEKRKWSRSNVSILQQWIDDFRINKTLTTNSFECLRDWTFLTDIPSAIHSIIENNNNFKILNLVSPHILKDIDVMREITKNKKLLKSKNIKAIHNASYSIYLDKIKFKNWTSPKKAIRLIKRVNDEKT